jgi:hypothetical protein
LNGITGGIEKGARARAARTQDSFIKHNIIFYTLLTFVYKLLTIKIFLSALALSESAFDYFPPLSFSFVRSRLSRAASSKIYKYECEMLLALLALSQGIRSIFILNQMYQSAARFKVKCSGYVIILFQKAERLQFTRQTHYIQLRQPIFFFILLVFCLLRCHLSKEATQKMPNHCRNKRA